MTKISLSSTRILAYACAAVAAAAAIVGAATAAEASTSTATIAVSATVLSSCVVGATPMAFGNYSGAILNDTTSVTALCTSGTPYTISLDNGTGSGATTASRKMTGSGSGTLSYSIYSDAAHTSVWGSTAGTNTVSGTGNGLIQTISAYGQIPASQLPSPGIYTDTVTVTLTY